MAEEMTRAQLGEELRKERESKIELEARLARLEAAFSAKPAEPDPMTRARLRDAEEELANLRPHAKLMATLPQGKAPQFVPYKGLVRAKEDCTYDGYRKGPVTGNKPEESASGEVFAVDLPVFWSDNPFEPVRQTKEGFEHNPECVVIDYRWRLKLAQSQEPMARAV